VEPDPFLRARWQIAGNTHTTASLRGLSALDQNVCWASGSGGTVLRTVDGGATWEAVGPADASGLDFRAVHAFDRDNAWVVDAGQPARIYHTMDGGGHWQVAYADDKPAAFFDGIAFWDRNAGILFGDPVDGTFCVLRTQDGEHWSSVAASVPAPGPGEAGFAASGTNLCTFGRQHVWIVTGGTASRVLASTDRGQTWSQRPLPLQQGSASQGAFSVAFLDLQRGVVVGGDYTHPEDSNGTAAYTTDGGITWVAAPQGALGYRSCVAWLLGRSRPVCIAVGDRGSSVSTDGGRTWRALSPDGFHTVCTTYDGTVWAAGSGGRTARLQLQ
jgi:photosystem II stability/assembly factor-like uncharacterized protein